MATTIMFAKIKFLIVTFSYFLKKYKNPIDGIVNNAIKCTPNDSPMTKLIKSNHLFPFGSSIAASQRNPSQNNNAIIKVAIA